MTPTAHTMGKVAVLMGGASAEREISLMSGAGVLQALQARGVDAHAFDPAERDLHVLRDDGFARCFIALHGRFGEDGTVQGALELLGIPYTGSGVMASAIAIDKVMTKRVWLAEGLPTPAYRLLQAGQYERPQVIGLPDELGLPLIVKPAREGSSIGVVKVLGYSQMQAAVAQAAQLDSDVLCEQFISGDEVTCPIIGSGAQARALPVIRIVAPEGNYDYQHKYFTDDTQYLVPCGLPEGEEEHIQALALRAYQVLGCRGWGRVDVMIDGRTRKPSLLEINTSPGMTSHSLVPMSARAAGHRATKICACSCSRVLHWTTGVRQRLTHNPAGRHDMASQRNGPSTESKGRAPGALRRPARAGDKGMNDALMLPFDVRLMHVTANAMLVVFVLVALAALAQWIAQRPVFAIASITVSGDVTHNNEPTLRANVTPRLAGNFFTLDLVQARQLFEAMPWVRHAVVRREFPNRLRVELQEHQAVAYWGLEERARACSTTMVRCSRPTSAKSSTSPCPVWMVRRDRSLRCWPCTRCCTPCSRRWNWSWNNSTLSGRGGWRAQLDSGAVIELGRGSDDEVIQRAARFLRTITQVTSRYNRRPDAVESADLRHADGYALRLRGVSTVVTDSQKK